MTYTRLIARLDVKPPNLIKGINLEGLRKIGDPAEYARKYYAAGADEIVYMDIVASLYGRNSLGDIVRTTTENVFVPITVGGGIRNLGDVETLLRDGADKVAVNTAAIARPELITEIANHFGSQCMVLSVEAKQTAQGEWEAYTDNGREKTGRAVVAWVREAVDRGAGEILLTSVDREGTRRGFDVALTRAVSQAAKVPVIASGGMGEFSHLADVVKDGAADAVAIADMLHYDRATLGDIRRAARAAGIRVRSA